MAIVQSRSRRKASGGRYRSARKNRKFEFGREPTLTRLDENTKKKVISGRNNHIKVAILRTNKINVLNNDKKYVQETITKVLEVPANRNYQIRNIITKGSIVQTNIGQVKVTSRPGRDGTINGVLINNIVTKAKKSKKGSKK